MIISLDLSSDSMQALAEVPQARHVPGFGVLIDDCRASLCVCQHVNRSECNASRYKRIYFPASCTWEARTLESICCTPKLLEPFEKTASCLAQGYRAAKCGTGSAEVSD